MKVLDVSPGYLDTHRLLNEYREISSIASFLSRRTTDSAAPPEVQRWRGKGWALRIRHRLLFFERMLRGYREEAPPITTRSGKGCWPDDYVAGPEQQFEILQRERAPGATGRIPIPTNVQQLWSHHKYSVLARDPNLYKKIGPLLSTPGTRFGELSLILTESLRQSPTPGGIRNSVQHMWGYVARDFQGSKQNIESWSTRRLLQETQRIAMAHNVTYLQHSTALGELMTWL